MPIKRHDDIVSMRPADLEYYLVQTGWIVRDYLGADATIWTRPERHGRDWEVIQPTRTEFRDYGQRVYEALYGISEFEGIDVDQVVEAVVNAGADTLKVQVTHQDVEEGTIPMEDGVHLISSTRDLVVASVLATFKKRRLHSGARPKDAQRYLETIRMAQTEGGSYIVNVLAPLRPVGADGHQELQSSIGRLVMHSLARSLSALKDAIGQYEERNDPTVFEPAVDDGVSANLCDSLVGISGVTRERDFSVRIRPSKAVPDESELVTDHVFANRDVVALRTASEYYKGNFTIPNYRAYGPVVDMHHAPDEENGTIKVLSAVAEKEKKITISLALDDYYEAIDAHRTGKCVECYGQLQVTPRTATLLECFHFSVVGTGDLF